MECKTSRINHKIVLTEQEITLRGEYRQALITEAVAGKIDIGDYSLEE